MSATPARPDVGPRPELQTARVTFPHVLRSEWIKLVTVRSTWWTFGLTLVALVGFALLQAATFDTSGVVAPVDLYVLTSGTYLAQVLVAVLGVLAMTSEHATGMIRATMTAVPARVPVLLAKAVVLLVVAMAMGVVGVLLSSLATLPLYGASAPDLGSSDAFRFVLGTGLYLAGVALLSLFLGALVRSTAAGVAGALTLLLIFPIVLGLLSGQVPTLADFIPYLPGEAGSRVVAVVPDSDGGLAPWVGLGVMALWVLALGALTTLLLRRRDV